MREMWHRHWPVDLLAIVFLVVAFLFGSYLQYRQQLADQRAARTRQSLCAIIDRIPAGVDIGIDEARRLDACGRPHPPSVFFGRPFPTPRPTVTLSPSPEPQPTVVIRLVPATTSAATPSPAPSRTAPPSPTPRPTPTRTHPPSPSPSPTSVCRLLPLLCP